VLVEVVPVAVDVADPLVLVDPVAVLVLVPVVDVLPDATVAVDPVVDVDVVALGAGVAGAAGVPAGLVVTVVVVVDVVVVVFPGTHFPPDKISPNLLEQVSQAIPLSLKVKGKVPAGQAATHSLPLAIKFLPQFSQTLEGRTPIAT